MQVFVKLSTTNPHHIILGIVHLHFAFLQLIIHVLVLHIQQIIDPRSKALLRHKNIQIQVWHINSRIGLAFAKIIYFFKIRNLPTEYRSHYSILVNLVHIMIIISFHVEKVVLQWCESKDVSLQKLCMQVLLYSKVQDNPNLKVRGIMKQCALEGELKFILVKQVLL